MSLERPKMAPISPKKTKMASTTAQNCLRQATMAPIGPSAAPAPMETDHLAEHLGNEELIPFFKQNLAEGTDVEKFTKHFLDMVHVNEAKRRKKG